jgi:hypothetical protein
MALIHLVYMSSAVRWPDMDELAELLHTAYENNRALGITGLLLYRKATFLQVLEGDEAAVRDVYARIQRDPRHTGLVKLIDEPLASRQFPDWTGSFELDDPQGAPDPGIPGYIDVFSDSSRVLARVADPSSRTVRLLLNFIRRA